MSFLLRLPPRFALFMDRFGANVAGFLYNAGGVFQLLAGAILSSPRDIAAALLNFACASILNFFGHKNSAVVIASVLAIIINILTAYAGLAAAEWSSLFGIAVHFSAETTCIFNAPLSRYYGASPSAFMRQTLGQPRRLVGLSVFVLCRLPLVYGNGLHHRWVPAIVFATWACADLAFAMSKPPLAPGTVRS